MPASLRKLPFLFVFVFIGFLLHAQTDSAARILQNTTALDTNSISFHTIRYKPQFVTNLPDKIKETSGLLFFNGQLWTINDSGNQPEIYQLDSAGGNILRAVVICNSMNKDWESITQDDSNIYIGDFGNNAGNRTDLQILKIAKPDLLNQENDTVKASFIRFIYPDQTHFSASFNKTDFDCEAFFFYNDSLHLFSKNWLDQQTKHYVLPVNEGMYEARLVESFDADGLITDAAINSKGNIVLLGYKNTRGRSYTCFAWVLSGIKGSAFFNQTKIRVELGSALHLGQTEGIVLKNDDTGWFSSESIRAGWFSESAKLFSFDFRSLY